MPQHLLDIPKFVPVPQGVGCEGMAQSMGGDIVDPRLARVRLQDQPEPLAGQPATAVIDEEGVFLVRGNAAATTLDVGTQVR